MAALASPTPISMTSHWVGGGEDLYRRPSKRTLLRTTSGQLGSRRDSPLALSSKTASRTFEEGVAAKIPVGDSSDDEDLAPIKLSAEAREILGEEASQVSSSPKQERGSDDSARRRLALRKAERSGQGAKEAERSSGSPVLRSAHHGSGGRPQISALARDGSFFYKKTGDYGQEGRRSDAFTPAPQMRTVRINGSRSQTRSPPSSSPATQTQNDGSEMKQGTGRQDQNRLGGEGSETNVEEDLAPHGPTTVQRNRRGEEYGLPSTMRVKRTGKMTGTFLNGPVRRGMIRRQSEDEDVHPQNNDGFSHGSPHKSQNPEIHDIGAVCESRSRSPTHRNVPSNSQAESHNGSPPENHVAFASSATILPLEEGAEIRHESINPPEPSTQSKPTSTSHGSNQSLRSSGNRLESMFQVPPPPDLPSAHDQENEPPPTFKRSKPAPTVLGEVHKVTVLGERNPNHATPATSSPQRKPLAPRSQNTPHRVAPPPPKMSVLEAATSNAGSTRSKKKVAWSVNGKLFTRLDCIGRGGSSRVYRVMAENYKMFALKRVNLEEADAASIIGYKGEIDLLRRLENVERVVRLFDYEINDEKGELKVLMEMGESDFNRMLNLQIKSENAKFDPSFTRHYWREMLECVQAVHDYGIVHSDLKPANFLVVQGRLKIIDFGIANAIQDNTVNVHRENQIGTPNYMSPEALVDCNAVNGRRDLKGQLLKIGKPSDVWSLGCILYQMVYGAPPFAHIANAHQRIMSIPNPKVTIIFPAIGVGGVPVPSGLLKILKRCLERDQSLRPTIPQMLGTSDPFLNPRELMADEVVIDQPMLGQVLQKVVHYCRLNPQSLPADGTLNEWAGTFLERIGRLDEGVKD
jgi:serine/threonine-protein kinase TTK/MPS1